jgi:hypothetical protein
MDLMDLLLRQGELSFGEPEQPGIPSTYQLPQPPPQVRTRPAFDPGAALSETYGPAIEGARGFFGRVGHGVIDPLRETTAGLTARLPERINDPDYLRTLEELRAANDARAAGIEQALQSPDFSLPVSPPEGEYRLPAPTEPGVLTEEERVDRARRMMEEATAAHRGAQSPFERGYGGAPWDAEGVAKAAEDEADSEIPTEFPLQIEKEGDVARAKAMRQLGMLMAMRDISEGFGRYVPVKGEITQGVTPEKWEPKGLNQLIDLSMSDLAAGDKLRLQEALRGRREFGLEKLRQKGEMARVKEQEKLRAQAATTAHERMMERTKVAEEQRQGGRLELLNKRLEAVGKKPLTDTSIGRLTAMDHMERDLIDVLKNKHKFNTGPLQELVDSSLEWALGEWAVSPERSGFKAKLNNILAWYVRAVEGGRPSDKDRVFLATVAPSPKDDDNQLVQKAQNLLAWVRRNRGDVLKYLETDRTLPEGTTSQILQNAIPFADLTPEQQAEGWQPDYQNVWLDDVPAEIPRENLDAFMKKYGARARLRD